MPRITSRYDSNVGRYCRQKGLDLKTSLPALLNQAARLVAVSASFQAQPFGNDERALALGVVATTRDIHRVYTTPGKAFDDIQDEHAKAGFWKAVKSSAWDRASKILFKSGAVLKHTPILPFDDGAQHRQRRNNQGRIAPSQKPVMVVRDPQRLKTYVKIEINKVGQGKGGWASCAKALGSTRGIARWITKHNSPSQVIESYSSNPMFVTMINKVPYATAILSQSQKAEAVRIAMDRLRRSILIAFDRSGRGATKQLVS